MKKLLFAVIAASLISTSAMAGWTGSMTVDEVRENPYGAGASVVATEVAGTFQTYHCYIRPSDVESGKRIVAEAITAKAGSGTAKLHIQFGGDPDGAISGTICLLNGIILE